MSERRVIGGDAEARAVAAKASVSGETPVQRKPGALVEDESVVGTVSGGVQTREPDGKIDEGATDRRESRR